MTRADGSRGFAHDAELGRQKHLAATAVDRASDQLLVGKRPVGVGSVEKVDPKI